MTRAATATEKTAAYSACARTGRALLSNRVRKFVRTGRRRRAPGGKGMCATNRMRGRVAGPASCQKPGYMKSRTG